MEKETQDQAGAGLLWFAVGIALGAAVGILVAPQPGHETRRRIGDLAADSRNSLADRGRDLIDRGRQYYAKGRDLADEAAGLFERGRNLVDS